jgi:hypothetical protein
MVFRHRLRATIAAMPEPRAVTSGNRRLPHAVRAVAAEQDGVIARSDLLARGLGESSIDRALRSGGLPRSFRPSC